MSRNPLIPKQGKNNTTGGDFKVFFILIFLAWCSSVYFSYYSYSSHSPYYLVIYSSVSHYLDIYSSVSPSPSPYYVDI